MLSVVLISLASLALPARGHPVTDTSHSLARRVVDLDAFRLISTSEYSNSTEVSADPSFSLFRRADPAETATELVKTTVPGATFRLVNDFWTGDNGVTHLNFKQTVHDLDIDNADFNVNIDKNGEVFSFGNSFYTGPIPEDTSLLKRDAIDPVDALQGAVGVLQLPVKANSASAEPTDGTETYTISGSTGAVKAPEARLMYLQTLENTLVLTWRVETDILSNWLLSYVDAKDSGKVHAVVDYSADATYQVFPWGINDPTEGDRVVLTDPWDSTASEFGWQSTGSETYTVTRGNNGIAQTNPSGGSSYLNNFRPSSPNQDYEYPLSLTSGGPASYANASVTQLFYTANMYHDLLYELGFTEKAGNFEMNNNGQGGAGNDMVILNSQDGSGTNNANFAAPPDGQNGRMRMYIWTTATPNRDCAYEAGVVIHEYTHGLSQRLTGGPANSNCLNSLEAGGMGEGWGDFMATAIRLKPSDTRTKDYPMGAWVNNNPGGIRLYPYSTSLTTNPHTYTDVNKITKVHPIGTVWATMLYEVLWNLIDKHGKNDNARPTFSNGVPTDGKFLTMKLLVDALALQPCNPNFVSARDAFLDADKALTGGMNSCEIWRGFAKRGLGTGARYSSTSRTASTAVPAGC
ncbi:extracellular metallo proteinase 1 [Patellaria atrata CBS 101060]|uniref:Extracellular metalloproteinase n=1 Tax=Patellaria atrata CBS 101060 TaxID=1346257 RepID=A0A9P4VSD5_9PEZI|nr:extracellular metallo proteinase 1 [Patellaria atrata CBS 101060]